MGGPGGAGVGVATGKLLTQKIHFYKCRNFYKCWAVAMGMRGYRPTEATASDAPTDFFARHGALSTLMCVEAPCVAILRTSIEAVRSGVTIRDLCRVLSSWESISG